MMISGENLELNPDQRVALAAIGAAAHAMQFVGITVGLAAAPSLVSAASAVVSGTQCPFGSPPSDLIADFDSGRNMYLRCLHFPHHCWNLSGNSITCP
jgi:hypothetical protein